MIDLIALGFAPAGSCQCNGSINKKYKYGEWLIYLTKTKFRVKRNGITVKSYTSVEHLETYLRQAIPVLFA